MNLVFLLEEGSAKEMLKSIVPKILNKNNLVDIETTYIAFRGKSDLKKRINLKIRNYNVPNAIFLVMCDKDSANCQELKNDLLKKIPENKKNKTLIRIACTELESFYLGDLQAVEKGLNIKGLQKEQNKNKFRNPDKLSNAANELKKLTKMNYQKIEGSRKISHYLKIENNQSHSFLALCNGIRKLISKRNQTHG